MLRAFEAVTRTFLPERCAACDALTLAPGLCAACAESLYPLGVACPSCAEPEQAPLPLICGRCLMRPPPFLRVVAPFRYGGELATAIKRWKYGAAGRSGRPELTRGLAALLAPALSAVSAHVDLLVAVPIHRSRLVQRGFSQVERLVAVACKLAGRDVAPHRVNALRRVRATPAQAGLSLADRHANVRGAFAARDLTARVRGLASARVALVDDVMTSGATAAAASRALLAAGATSVTVLVLGRAES